MPRSRRGGSSALRQSSERKHIYVYMAVYFYYGAKNVPNFFDNVLPVDYTITVSWGNLTRYLLAESSYIL